MNPRREKRTEVYTIDGDVFANTYRQIGPGAFVKCTSVWAEVARVLGRVATKEGGTAYAAGDYLVSNDEDGSDSYAISKAKFEAMYEPDVWSRRMPVADRRRWVARCDLCEPHSIVAAGGGAR